MKKADIGMSNYLVRRLLGLAIALFFLCHSADWVRIPLINTLDAFIYDSRLRLTAPGGVDERIVIVDIDEKSLAEVGRWPWSRNKMAELTNRLFDHYGIAILGFDVVFAEPDQSSGLPSLEALAKGSLKDDQSFQSALSSIRNTLDYDRQIAE